MAKEKESKGEIIIYKEPGGDTNISVRIEDESVWLSQKQIAELFGKDVRTVSEHVLNIYKEGELERDSTIRKFRIVQKEGKREVGRKTDFYNLDVIISVGYRVKSKRGTQFRIWANKTLKKYLLKGYVLNEKVLEIEGKRKELTRAINLVNEKVNLPALDGQEKELINIINSYANSLTILEKYDKGRLAKRGKKKPSFIIDYKRAQEITRELRRKLIEKEEISKSDLFGREAGNKLDSAVSCIYQTYDGRDLYPTVEEKAANLLYLVTKGHVFSDGNKRIGAIFFIYFLDKNDYLYNDKSERKINDNSLAALALLVANSDPKEKDVIIKLVVNLIKG